MGTLALFILTAIPALVFATWWERRRLRREIAELDRMEREWLASQRELDPDSKRVLYSNLRDLYRR